MKLPNGYGTVTKLSGNRRKPYGVKEGISGKQKPIGYTPHGKKGLSFLPNTIMIIGTYRRTKSRFRNYISCGLKSGLSNSRLQTKVT